MDFPQLEKFILDLMESSLPPGLFYHSPGHTLDVQKSAERIAESEGITGESLMLLKTAALLHDIGFTRSYRDHEDQSQIIAKEVLIKWDFTEEQIQLVCEMIEATRIPQTPKSHLAEILCDADLDYLGRPDFKPIGDTLFQEFMEHGIVKNETEWNQLQIRFLSGHHYFTRFGKEKREPVKARHLAELINIYGRGF